MNPETNPSPKFLIILVVAALALGGAWYYFMQAPAAEPLEETEESETAANSEGISVTKVDVSKAGESKLPAGFPQGIPVEESNVSESYRVVYAEHGVTQYTVSYTSLKGRDALWDAYSEYMKNEGYAVDASVTSKSQGQISGNKGDDTLAVIISSRNSLSFVQLNLLDRK